MAADFHFDHRLEFTPELAAEILRSIPAAPGIFALRGSAENAEPYLTRAADIRRRLRRLLAPPEALNEDGTPVLSKRLNLRDRVAFIEYTRTGSEFESMLTLYRATRHIFGAEQARKRLRLYPPYFLRITTQHDHPRVYATNRLTRKSFAESFGPFPSRAAAERYADAVLDLFKLRRCHEDLAPFPDHPGCAYGEMNKCLAPCKQSCTAEQYATEAQQVFAFFATHGASMLTDLATQRDAASEALDFERAATLHTQYEKIRSAAQQADELVRPLADLRAVIVQPAAPREPAPAPTTQLSSRPESAFSADGAERPPHLFSPTPTETLSSRPHPGAPSMAEPHPAMSGPATMPTPDEAAIFLLDAGLLCGPARLSTLGVRAVREQTAVGSSLFAQPLMLSAIPLEPAPATNTPTSNSVILSEGAEPHPAPQSKDLPNPTPPQKTQTLSASNLSPEDRARQILTQLEQQTHAAAEPDIAERCDYLSLFRRWYYRPEKQRTGEAFLPNAALSSKDPADTFPIRRILNAAARAALGPPAPVAPVDREAAKLLKTKILHQGRADVEREVPILPKRSRRRKSITPADVSTDPE